MVIPLRVIEQDVPSVELSSLDVLWFQVGGTICNLRCNHCFISCSPENDKFGFMSLDDCTPYIDESVKLGVKEYYFTGGEPFANPQLLNILEATLRHGPTTILTNATLLPDRTLDRLEALRAASPHAIEIRVSIDGYSAEMNDPIRGEGTFDKAMAGVGKLVARGFHPIVTITRTWPDCQEAEVLRSFRRTLQAVGYDQPRLKVLPSLKLGAEVSRSRGYHDDECLTPAMLEGYDMSQLVCSNSRTVTDQGVWVCPILIDSAAARMGDTLQETLRPQPLNHQACFTCWQHGAICSNSTCSDG